MMRNPEQTLGNLIDKQSVAYVSSVDEDGCPNTKAMYAPRLREGIRVLYFTTNLSALRTQQFLRRPQACVYFADRRFYRGVMLKGTMEILTDETTKAMIWKDGDERFYPKGIQDPDYCVLKFTVRSGRYYASSRSEDFSLPAQE